MSIVTLDGVPRRVPKLAVRNRFSNGEGSIERTLSIPSDTTSEREGSAPPSSHSSSRLGTPISYRSSSNESVPTVQRLSDKEVPKHKPSSQPAKKKKGGVLGFLTLKEPSTSAWAEFAEAEKAKAKQKGIDPATKGIPGVSSQRRLPEHVPKVNSKWDGLPDAARESLESRASSKAKRSGTFSTSTRQLTGTAISSASADSRWARETPWSFPSPLQSPTWPYRPSHDLPVLVDGQISSYGSTRQPPALAVQAGTRTDVIEQSSENMPQTILLPPSPIDQETTALPELDGHLIRSELSGRLTPPELAGRLTPPELDGREVSACHLQELDMRHSTNSSPVGPLSPLTPLGFGSDLQPALIGIHYPELDSHELELTDNNPKAVSDADQQRSTIVAAPARPDRYRRSVNFIRPRTKKPILSHLATEALPETAANKLRPTSDDLVALSPTLKNESGQIDPFLTDTFANHSRETGNIPRRAVSTLRSDVLQPVDSCAEASRSDCEGSLTTTNEPDDIPAASQPDTAQPSTEEYRDAGVFRSNSRASLTPSVAPSHLSEQWRMSPKERLGLGGRLRKGDVLPWEVTEDLQNNAELLVPDRLSPPIMPESKLDRLSWRRSPKR
ncbi:hypothetical protein LTR37_013857 [Vermiconidia calcicola]|uniref:Uncharacterized protein n=1 Tax=Vermiconidia calcicola TaxID=1690605 RepID=A0ACC3MWV6_9PEZI|nr:hypothetical protein LTR37_013857 [Vermiconidia calcicola]